MRKLGIVVAVAVMISLAACGGGSSTKNGATSNSSSKDTAAAAPVFFPVDQADKLAHQVMPSVSDLPGPGWELTAQDKFDDSQDNGFDKTMANEPACAQLKTLEALGGVFGSSSNEQPPAGRAKVEFANSAARGQIPTSVEVDAEIERTGAEVEGSWGLAKDLLSSDQTQQCMLAVFKTAFAESGDLSGVQADVTQRKVSASAPRGGATMGFDIHMDIAGIKMDMAMEMYIWPYGNASATVMFLGEPDAITSQLTEPVLRVVDDKIVAAGKAAGQSSGGS